MDSSRMTIVASFTGIRIVLNLRVMGIHIGLVVGMADGAVEGSEIGRDCVAFDTLGPSTDMGTGIDREELSVMIPGRW